MSSAEDRFDIIAALDRYAECLDTRDWPGLADVFTEDVDMDFGVWRASNLDAVRTNIRSFLDGCGPSQHLLGNYRIAVNGDAATSRCYCRVMHHGKGDHEGKSFESWIEYADEFERTPDGWRSRRRVATPQMNEGDPTLLGPGQLPLNVRPLSDIQANNIIQGLMGEMTNRLRKFGYEAAVVYAGNTPADGTRDDVMPRNERQRKVAELNPAKLSDVMLGSIPLISQRMLAGAAGVGFFGLPRNILTLTHGAAVSLVAVVTTADLPPTPMLPPEANDCDECNWCGNVCPTSFMSRTDFTTVEMGENDHHKYSTREHHMRCASHMAGLTGRSEGGKYGSWGPSRKQLPKNDDELLPTIMGLAGDLMKRPTVRGGFYDPQKGTKTNVMCSACNLVCHLEKKLRAKRMKMWLQGGVSIQREDRSVQTMPLDEARAYLDAIPPEKQALYEDVPGTDA